MTGAQEDDFLNAMKNSPARYPFLVIIVNNQDIRTIISLPIYLVSFFQGGRKGAKTERSLKVLVIQIEHHFFL